MTSHHAPGMIHIRGPLLMVLELIRRLATSVLGEHSDDAGVCTMCGEIWPCENVVLAASNLSVI